MVAIGPVFAAVRPSQDAVVAIHHATAEMPIPGRRTPPENWHLTLRYLGRVEEVVYERFLHGLGGLAEVAPFRVVMGGVGAFPNPRRATVVWAGVAEGEEGLGLLAEIAEEAAVAAGLEPEDRPFRPHLTLSRVHPPADVTGLLGEPVPARWKVAEVIVYRSVHGRGGVSYEPLETVPLGA
nr:MAG: RNA 2',3'-cyclic phosphodiesterase [Actinomycetota bacterium]